MQLKAQKLDDVRSKLVVVTQMQTKPRPKPRKRIHGAEWRMVRRAATANIQ